MPRYRRPRSSLGALALAAGERAATTIAWRQRPDDQPLVSRFVALRVRPARGQAPPGGSRRGVAAALAAGRVPEGADEPIKSWLASLDEDLPLVDLVRLAKLRWRVEHDDRELKDALGLDHFEGRSFTGWHHHLTLVSVAHAFVASQRLDPKAAAPV